jgi:hypothetical protein
VVDRGRNALGAGGRRLEVVRIVEKVRSLLR